MKKNKNKIIMAFKILKQSITSTKSDFSDYVSINFTFQVSSYVLFLHCLGYNYFSWDLNTSRVTKKC